MNIGGSCDIRGSFKAAPYPVLLVLHEGIEDEKKKRQCFTKPQNHMAHSMYLSPRTHRRPRRHLAAEGVQGKRGERERRKKERRQITTVVDASTAFGRTTPAQ